MGCVVSDGYDRRGYIAAVERLHDAMDFRFRPMLWEETDYFTAEEFRRKPSAKRAELMAAAIREKLVEWSEGGKPTVDAIRRLPWPVFEKLFNIVCGFSASDPFPASADSCNPGDFNEYEKRLLVSATTGIPVGLVGEQADEKNSGTG